MGQALRVTDLKVQGHPNAVVPAGEEVVIFATTEPVEAHGPTDLNIEWGGDLGSNPRFSGSLETSFAAGAHTVTAKGRAGGISLTVRAWQAEVEVVNGLRFAISDKPKMPVIAARLRVTGPVATSINDWTCSVRFSSADDCHNIPTFGVINDDLELTQTGGDQFAPRFDKVRGRDVNFRVRFLIQGEPQEAFAVAGISGTNPQRSEVHRQLRRNALLRIACRESGQRQFDAAPNGGVSACPLFSSDPSGRVGIMQVPDPTPDQIWDWKENVKRGIEIFKERESAAKKYVETVRGSDAFNTLVSNFHERRQQQGLAPILVELPDFEDWQLEMDAIRGYNGWNGTDRFGLELHEFRVAVEQSNGDEVLVVTDISDGSGKAVWERVPVTDRPAHIGNPNYVEEVLAFASDCSTSQLSVDIRAEHGTNPPCRILRLSASRKYRAMVDPPGGTFNWTCTGGASIVGSASRQVVEVKGKEISTQLDDVVLTLQYKRGSSSQTKRIKLTVAAVKNVIVRVKASAALTPGRGAALDDHQFECTETRQTNKAFENALATLILLTGKFDDVELQATVQPQGTPLAWDVKRARDDHASLGTGIPNLIPDPGDVTKAKLQTNETGSFFVRAFADCGNKKFDPSTPVIVVPTVLVRAKLLQDDSKVHPGNPESAASVVDNGLIKGFLVETGNKKQFDPENSAIHMKATVGLVSGGPKGRRLIVDKHSDFVHEGVFVGWVNNVIGANIVGTYARKHTHFVEYDVAPPLLDTRRSDPGSGGASATPHDSACRNDFKKLDPGLQWTEESVDLPGHIFPLEHPDFRTHLRKVHFEIHFRAHLCLWTNRSGSPKDVAERSYGVLHSYKWHVLGEWKIDNANNTTVVTPLSDSPPIDERVTHNPEAGGLVKPKDAQCEICPPEVKSVESTRTT